MVTKVMENLKTALTWFDLVSAKDEEIKYKIIDQFVQDVIAFSSQYGSDISFSYSALNLSGKPSIYPDYGDFPQACVTRTYGRWWHEAPSNSRDFQPQNNGDIASYDFVDLIFQQEVFPTDVKIYETYNPGAVVRIWAKRRDGWTKLWEGKPQTVGHVARIFEPKIRKINFKTRLLRIELNQKHLPYYTELDAFMLEGTEKLRRENNVYSKREDLSRLSSDEDLTSICPLEKANLKSRVMELGLHNDLITDYEVIQNIFKEDFRKLFCTETLMGDFQQLPDETILKIFSFLDLQSLSRCAQVNKVFHRLSRDPILYKSLNLKPYWYCVDEHVLSMLASRATLIQKLDLSWCGHYEALNSYDFMEFIHIRGSSLTHLRLNSCTFLNSLSITCVAENCSNLKELSLRSCGNIKSGFLQLSQLKNLTRLDLYRTLVDKSSLLAIIRANKGLLHLNLGSCGCVSSMDEVAIEIGRNCKDLISIDLWKTYSLTSIGVKALITCSKLQEVDFGWCLQVGSSGEWVSELASNCRSLRKLFLGALRAISDKDLRPLATLCPDLEQLDLFGVRAITTDVCELLLVKCKKLKLFDISFCDQISDVQADAWRDVFPRVAIKRSFTSEATNTQGVYSFR